MCKQSYSGETLGVCLTFLGDRISQQILCYSSFYLLIYFLKLLIDLLSDLIFLLFLPRILLLPTWFILLVSLSTEVFFLTFWVFHFYHHFSLAFVQQFFLLNFIFRSWIHFCISFMSLFSFFWSAFISLSCLNIVAIILLSSLSGSFSRSFTLRCYYYVISTLWKRHTVLLFFHVLGLAHLK